MTDGNAEMLASGSSAEFCIKPMHSCIGDFDVMCVSNNDIAIAHGHTPPRELPANYRSFVYVYEIIESDQPGFVHLKTSHALTKQDNGLYVAEKIENNKTVFLKRVVPEPAPKEVFQQFANHEVLNNRSVQSLLTPAIVRSLLTPAIVRHGPATTFTVINDKSANEAYKITHFQFSHISIDVVPCMRCQLWPIPASSWPTRCRDHGWPAQKTINEVVSNGCDLVGAVHPVCRQDEWMNEHQWRLSFSRAEVTLLNSWTKVQQIVYHMLRFVLKREVFPKTDDKEQDLPKLSNYHIKTLMLWECEQKPQSWWSAESSLIKLCSSLLHKLSEWVEDEHCQHYFIDSCNLLDHFVKDTSTTISNSLRILAEESVLLTWFTENYIRRGALYCPDDVSVLFEDISFSDKLERAVDAVVDWKLNTLTDELCTKQYEFEKMAISRVLFFRTDAIWIQAYMKATQNVDPQLRVYFVAVVSLRAAYKMSMNSPTEDQLEILWTLFDPCPAAADGIFSRQNSGGLLWIQRAIMLGALSTVRSTALDIFHNEMSKAFLHHSFVYGQESTYCVARILLAALYYNSGHYQSATIQCKQVLNQCKGKQCGSYRIGKEYLLQTDETVDTVFGLVLLYEHLQQKALKSDTEPQSSKLTLETHLLAHYFYWKCATATDSETRRMRKYRQHLCWTGSPLLCDVLLFKETETHIGEGAKMSVEHMRANDGKNVSSPMDTGLLVAMLELVALEKLVKVRQVLVHELHSERFPVLNEFEALYSYKCGLLEECLDMCRRNVNVLLRAGCPRYQHYLIVMPEFLSLLDGEVLSLFGIIRLLRPVFILLLLELADNDSISLTTLSLYLMVQCQKMLRSDSLCDTLQLIRIVHDKMFPADGNKTFLDRLILKLIYRSLKLYIDDQRKL